MSRMQLLERADGTNVEGFCLIKAAAARLDSKGQEYLDLVLTDCKGECAAKLWSYSKASHGLFAANDVVKIRGSIQYWKDCEQIKVDRIRHSLPQDEVNMAELVPCAPIDPSEAYDELYAEAERFKNDELRRLVQYLLRENKDALLIYPAGVKLHHATRGGLLHHSLSIVRLGKSIAAQYENLDGELITAGAILHDIGKLDELEVSSLGLAGAYTAQGQLIGHINIGLSKVSAAAELLGVSEETSMLIEHMLLSHHGQPEFGSPKLPMFPEAEVLSVCDLLDSKLYEMFDALEGVAEGGFTERLWALDNRQLYKKRSSEA